MRLNFWQWLGLLLLVGAGGVWLLNSTNERANPLPATTVPAPAATAPAAT
ncbi:MAG TPA: hypothetical protein VK324_02530 [Tepidisphaeraceae bacterium]|nr:hypothetical protein [Tepidisphaeraceae bacterium]